MIIIFSVREPFHDNTDTPAARIYHNPEGDVLFCYSERRRYKPSDVISKGLLNVRLETIFYKIWRQLDDANKSYLLTEFGKPIDYLPERWRENEEVLKGFQLGTMSLSDFQMLVLNLIS